MTFPKPRRATCALTVSESDQLQAAATADGRTVSDYLRRLLVAHLAELHQEPT